MKDNNNHITYTAADIEKYWKGQLSAADQYALEKAALEDPFLADAMEGYEEKGVDNAQVIAADLDELKKRLANRVAEKKKAVVVPFAWRRIAAMLIVVAGAGWLYMVFNKSTNTDGLVKNQTLKDLQKETPAPGRMDSAVPGKTLLLDSLSSDIAINKKLPTDNTGEKQPAVTQPEFKRDAAVPSSSNNVEAETRAAEQDIIANNQAAGNKEAAAPPEAAKRELNKSVAVTPSQRNQGFAVADDKAVNARDGYLSNTFNGNVLDQAKKPVANAFIQIPNLNVATQTDNKGYFSFKASDSVLTVSIASAGFETQNLRLHDSASLNQIILKPAPNHLAEVVVQTNGAEKRKKSAREEISIKILDAEPVIGWDKYRDYLAKNKKVAEDVKNIHGSVLVSFTVRTRGMDNFAIEQSLNEDLDEEAIRLIKTGPAWKLLKGKKATATVIVKF